MEKGKKIAIIGGGLLVIGGLLFAFKDKIFKKKTDETTKVGVSFENENLSPDAETPSEETPSEETPNVETPSDETPNVETPSVETPKTETKTSVTLQGATPTIVKKVYYATGDSSQDLYNRIITTTAFIVTSKDENIKEKLKEVKNKLALVGKDIYSDLYEVAKSQYKNEKNSEEVFAKIGNDRRFKKIVTKYIKTGVIE